LCAATSINPPEKTVAQRAGQHLIRRAEITLNVSDVERAASELDELAWTVRGRLGDKTVYLSSRRLEVKATLMLPPEMLDTALARLRAMALTVLGEESQSRDVSSQVAELTRQLEQLRATRRQLRDLMDRLATDAEQRRVQTPLSQVEAEIVDAEAALTGLRREADAAIIRILAIETIPTYTPTPSPTPSPTPTYTPVPPTPSPAPWRPDETVKQASSVLGFILRNMTDVLIIGTVLCGPPLVVLLAGWWAVRWWRSR
jgi:hypothetical protein